MIKRFPISKEGLDKLYSELRKLKNVDRIEIVSAIANAREHGDLSENFEYHAAREKQGFIEAKISELEDKISRAEVIDISKIDSSDIKYGASVKLLDEEKKQEITYKIVGDYEADVSKGLISISSPLAQALLGKKIKQCIEFKTPKGIRYYQILLIYYN